MLEGASPPEGDGRGPAGSEGAEGSPGGGREGAGGSLDPGGGGHGEGRLPRDLPQGSGQGAQPHAESRQVGHCLTLSHSYLFTSSGCDFGQNESD